MVERCACTPRGSYVPTHVPYGWRFARRVPIRSSFAQWGPWIAVIICNHLLLTEEREIQQTRSSLNGSKALSCPFPASHGDHSCQIHDAERSNSGVKMKKDDSHKFADCAFDSDLLRQLFTGLHEDMFHDLCSWQCACWATLFVPTNSRSAKPEYRQSCCTKTSWWLQQLLGIQISLWILG